MGRMVSAGWIGQAEVADALWKACETNRLLVDNGADAVQGTLASGLEAGIASPHEPLSNSSTNVASAETLPQPKILSVCWDGERTFTPRTWAVRDLIPEQSTGLLVGESQAGKSFLMVDLMVSCALGEPFLTKETKRGGSLFVAAEASSSIYERLEAARLGRAIPFCELHRSEGDNVIDPHRLPIAILDDVPNLALGDAANQLLAAAHNVKALMQSRHGLPLRFIIVDTMISAFGLQDWNNTAESSRAMGVLMRIMKETGAIAIGVHHHGKDISRGAAGSFALTAVPDFIISVFRDAEASGETTRRWIALTKTRGGPTGCTCDFQLLPQVVGEDTDGVVSNSAYVDVMEGAGEIIRSDQRKLPRESRALSAFKSAFEDALNQSGQRLPKLGNGPIVQVVPLDAVRSAFDTRYVTQAADPSKRADAARKAFSRALAETRGRKLVEEGHWMGKDWLWSPDDAAIAA
jgi:hypothetical protein